MRRAIGILCFDFAFHFGFGRNRAAVGVADLPTNVCLNTISHRGPQVMFDPFGRRMQVIQREVGVASQPCLPEPVGSHDDPSLFAALH